jgi:hypothetical protein
MQINQYANEAFQINDEDFYDVDFWTGTAFESRKISGATLKSILSSGGEWGSITGSLSDQTDLQTALDNLQTAIDAKQDELISGTTIKTVEGQSILGAGNIDLSKSDVGLSNVDNTSDLNKPISTATQTALNGKQDTLVSGTTIKTLEGQSLLGSGNIDLNKSDVGLSNVDNTSDLNKPISTATQTALNGKFDNPTGTTAQYIDGTGALQTFPTFLESDALISEVYNSTGSPLLKGTIVYINGGQGNLPTVTKAQADTDANSAQTFGWVRDDINNMSNGYVIVAGKLDNLNTNGLGTGTQLYLSPTTAGQYVTIKPQAPQHLVYVGIVVRDHPTQGVIEVKIQNGYELDELHDVLISASPNDGDLLTYDGATNLWKNVPSLNPPPVSQVLFADLATTEPLKPCLYNNGTGGVGATLTGTANGQLSTTSFTDKIDNVVTALDQIILVKNQFTRSFNGIYIVTQLGSASQPFILTRIADADATEELYPIQVNVLGGTINTDLAFFQKTIDPIIGTSDIVFTQIANTTATNVQVLFVDTATSSALPACTYFNGSNPQVPGIGAYLLADVNGPLGSINGISTFSIGVRILVKNQANPAQNGSYAVSNTGGITTRWRLNRVDAFGSNFVRLQREWKVNNPNSILYGSRYSTGLSALSNSQVGTAPINFSEIVGTEFIPKIGGSNLARFYLWANGSTTLFFSGLSTGAASGTQTALTVTGTTATKVIRTRFTGGTTSGSVAGYRGLGLDFFVGTGFYASFTFGFSDTTFNTSAYNWVGFQNSTSVLIGSTTYGSNLQNIIGVGNDPSDSTLQILHNDGTGSATKIALNSNFPANRTSGAAFSGMYCLELFNPLNVTNIVRWRITRIDTGDVQTGIINNNLPATNIGLNPVILRGNGLSASIAPIMDVGSFIAYSLF